jgi:hypothetical protein
MELAAALAGSPHLSGCRRFDTSGEPGSQPSPSLCTSWRYLSERSAAATSAVMRRREPSSSATARSRSSRDLVGRSAARRAAMTHERTAARRSRASIRAAISASDLGLSLAVRVTSVRAGEDHAHARPRQRQRVVTATFSSALKEKCGMALGSAVRACGCGAPGLARGLIVVARSDVRFFRRDPPAAQVGSGDGGVAIRVHRLAGREGRLTAMPIIGRGTGDVGVPRQARPLPGGKTGHQAGEACAQRPLRAWRRRCALRSDRRRDHEGHGGLGPAGLSPSSDGAARVERGALRSRRRGA